MFEQGFSGFRLSYVAYSCILDCLYVTLIDTFNDTIYVTSLCSKKAYPFVGPRK